MPKHNFTATIINDGRRSHWLQVFQTDTIPIKSATPYLANLNGLAEPAYVYDVDLRAITSVQRQALIDHISQKFGYDPTYVENELDRLGLPILADDVTVTIHRPELFL